MKVTDRMLSDILGTGLTGNGELPMEETNGKLLNLPGLRFSGARNSNNMIKIHIKNLIATYGLDSVMYNVTEAIKDSK